MKVKINYKKLIENATKAYQNSYSPYSNFKVGASVLCANGKIYNGTNIENSSYPCGICAERVAISKAISEGETKFMAMAITSNDNKQYCYPCGMCRQFLSEFGNIKIIVAKSTTDFIETDLDCLLPHKFNLVDV